MIAKFKYWLCHLLCRELVFNSDMSLEIDRLVKENDSLREQINDQ